MYCYINKICCLVTATFVPPTILDIEASGFGSESYPIEIGIARYDGARFCRLIKPFASWTHWDDEAQHLHGISRQHLVEFGLSGVEVCHQLNSFMSGQTAYSDGWVVDSPWLNKLYAAAGVAMTFRLSALEYILKEKQMNQWHTVKRIVTRELPEKRHRASVDAEIIQQTYMRTAASLRVAG